MEIVVIMHRGRCVYDKLYWRLGGGLLHGVSNVTLWSCAAPVRDGGPDTTPGEGDS